MGLWSQLKESVITATASVLNHPTSHRVILLSGDWNLRVVGGEYVNKSSQAVPVDVEFPVELRREMDNRHDKHAIMVMHKGVKIGYISSTYATKYAPLIDIANKNDQKIHVMATAQRDVGGWVSTKVNLSSVYEFALLLGPEASRIAQANKPPVEAYFNQVAKYKDQLEHVLAEMVERQIRAKIVIDETPSGKYQGQNMLRFFYRGVEIGILTSRSRVSNEEFFRDAESGKTTCKVLVSRDHYGRLYARATMY